MPTLRRQFIQGITRVAAATGSFHPLALLFCGGNSARVRRAWQVGAFTPLVSTATAQVWMTALAQPWLSRTAAVWQELSATGARDLLALAELTQLTFLTPDAFIATLE